MHASVNMKQCIEHFHSGFVNLGKWAYFGIKSAKTCEKSNQVNFLSQKLSIYWKYWPLQWSCPLSRLISAHYPEFRYKFGSCAALGCFWVKLLTLLYWTNFYPIMDDEMCRNLMIWFVKIKETVSFKMPHII